MRNDLMIVAELSTNHLGSLDIARDLVRAAADAGASAVKLQTFTPDTMTLNRKESRFCVSDEHELWGGQSLYSLYQVAQTPWEWHEELFSLAGDLGMTAFSSPFDTTAVDFLEELDCPIYKIASLEIVDIPLIRHAARTGKPLVMSTGAATISEIDEAVNVALGAGGGDVTLLVCTSSYPSRISDANLGRMNFLSERYGLPVGLSDHTLGLTVPMVAVSLGAKIVEKHLTLSRNSGGLDAEFSTEPEEFREMVKRCDEALSALGASEWISIPAENESRRLKRSLFVVRDVSAGEKLSNDSVRSIRPSGGMPPSRLSEIQGLEFSCAISAGTPLMEEHLVFP